MKIALVVHDLDRQGGHNYYTRILADELSRYHDVTVFANRCEGPEDSRWSFQPIHAWRINVLTTVGSFPLGLRPHAAALARFDIRHTQGFCGGRPNVVTAHICVAAYLASLREISQRTRFSLGIMAAAEARFYRRHAGTIIAVSHKVARELREFYDVRTNIKVIPHGVDTTRFNSPHPEHSRMALRAKVGVNEDQTLALYVGDLTKAHVHLKALARAMPEIQFAIVTRSRRYQWSVPNVHFLPPAVEIERYYAAADAFVFPSTYDSFGMVVLEAMASGLAVFSSDCAGAAEIIHSGKDGFVTPLEDWVEATRARLCDKVLLHSIGREAEQTARQYSWSAVARAVEQTYFEVALPGTACEAGSMS